MNKKSHVAIGPGSASLILIIVALAMSVLATLSLISVRSDSRLLERSIQVAQINYTLYDRSEETLRALAQSLGAGDPLPEGVTEEDGLYIWREESEGRVLSCAASLAEDGQTLIWQTHRIGVETEEVWD